VVRWLRHLPYMKGYAYSALCVAIATASGWMLWHVVPVGSIVLLYLIATLYTAIAYGLGQSLFAGFLGVLCYDFFFLAPYYTLYIENSEDAVRLAVFAIVAVVVSNLAARAHRQASNAEQRAKTSEELYRFSRQLARAVTLQDVLHATATGAATILHAQVELLLANAEKLEPQIVGEPARTLNSADLDAASWCLAYDRPTGPGTDMPLAARWHFAPMRAARGAIGVIGVLPQAQENGLSAEHERLFVAVADQAAQAIERVRLAEDLDRASRAVERDRLHSALLTSISHDLRTPLASILGSASNLTGKQFMSDDATRTELAQTIRDEAERLNRFISNLLDMTRLESGMLQADNCLVDLIDVVGAALERCGRIVADHCVHVDLPADLPMLAVDEVLLEHVLFNLLDNAAKYTPPGSSIQITARRDCKTITLKIIDEGDGIPVAESERIFDKFYRVTRADRQRAGTGLGLAICRGFAEAMGGTVTACNRSDRAGAVFTLTLPLPRDSGPPDIAAK
jgi:two-component system, OmpR family, sensor histidine kinase KdpD